MVGIAGSRRSRPGLGSAAAVAYIIRTGVPLHVGHGQALIEQDVPGPLMWLMSRYEHLVMRTINYLAMRDWIYRSERIGRLVEGLSGRVMSLVNGEVLSLEEATEMLGSLFEGGYTVAVGTCPCRRALNAISDEVPNNTDMVFGSWAEEYLSNYPGLYRRVDRNEAEELVRDFDRHGFLHQVYGFRTREKAAFVLCNCDPEICIPLRAQRTRGYQAFRKGRSAAAVDRRACLGVEVCGACLSRCPFGARSARDGATSVDRDLCFGCGLCVSTCRGGATALERKKGARLIYAGHLLE